MGAAYDVVLGIVKAVGSLEEPQGGTVALNGLPLPSVGYWVGGAGSSLVYPSFVLLDGPEIAAWVSRARTAYVGYWVDGSRIHLDWASWFMDRETAVAVGQTRGEAAVWDIENAAEIRL